MAFGYDGSIRIKADLNHSLFDRGLSSVEKQVNTFGSTLKKISGLVAVAFGTAALVNFAKESVKLASDIQEVQNVIDVTFGRGAEQIEEFAQAAAEAYGLSELSAKQYTGTMGAMLKSSGLAASAAQEMSMALTGLAGDIASFYNLDTDTAFEKIRSGISGETEPLKQLGINMSVANLEAYALSKGITKSYNAMSQAEQVLLRYNYLLSVTTDAQGDFARTSGSFANQIRILQLNFDQLRISVGNALIPIAEAVLPSINAIISGLTKLANVFAKVTALLFGKSPEVKTSSGIAASAGAAANATDKLAESTAGAGNAAKQAEKDMKGVLASFDELNILATNAADSVGSAGGGIGGAGVDTSDFEIPSYESEIEDVDKLGEAFESLGELFVKTLDNILAGMPAFKEALLNFANSFNEFNQKLYDAFTFPGVKDRVEELGRELADAFNGLVSAINWELWGRALGAGLNLGLQFLTEFLYSFDWINLGAKLAEFINGIVYEVDWYDFGRLLWAKFKLGLETFAGFLLGLDMPELAKAASNIIKGFFDSLQETITKIDWAGIGRQIAEFLNNIDWIGIIDSIAGALGKMIPAALELIGGFIENADTGTLIAAAIFFGSKFLESLIGKVLAPIGKKVADNLLKEIATAITGGESGGILAAISTTISNVASSISGIVKIVAPIVGVVGGAFMAISNFLEMLGNGFSWVNEAFMLLGIAIATVSAVILGAPAAVAAVVAGIVAVVATLVVIVKEHWEEIKQAFINAWNAVQEAWNAAGEWFNEHVIQPIAEFFSGLWESITQLASDAWNGIVEVWSAVSGWFDENVIRPLIEFFTGLWEDIAQFASAAWDGIVEIWQTVSGWFNENVIEPVSKFFSDLWDGIKTAASDLWDAIVSVWEDAGKWFEDHVTTPIKNAFQVVGDFIKSVLNNVVGGIEGLINGVIKGINWLISQLNKINFEVPGWVPVIGGKKFGFNISSVSEVKLPRLANGAVIPPNQQFAAILGDQRSGKNLEAPAGLIRQMVTEGIRAAGGIERGGDITVIMEVDGREFGRAAYRYGTAEQQRVGVRLVGVKS